MRMCRTKISVAACAGLVATMTTATYDAAATAASPAATASAEASAGWGPVVTLLRRMQVSRPDVVADAAGTITVVWSTSGSVTATRRPAGGTWGPRVVIGRGVAPQAGIDARGNVTVVWIRQQGRLRATGDGRPSSRAGAMATAGGDLRRGQG